MDRIHKVSGRGLAAILLAAFAIGYAVGESISRWTMVIGGLA